MRAACSTGQLLRSTVSMSLTSASATAFGSHQRRMDGRGSQNRRSAASISQSERWSRRSQWSLASTEKGERWSRLCDNLSADAVTRLAKSAAQLKLAQRDHVPYPKLRPTSFMTQNCEQGRVGQNCQTRNNLNPTANSPTASALKSQCLALQEPTALYPLLHSQWQEMRFWSCLWTELPEAA